MNGTHVNMIWTTIGLEIGIAKGSTSSKNIVTLLRSLNPQADIRIIPHLLLIMKNKNFLKVNSTRNEDGVNISWFALAEDVAMDATFPPARPFFKIPSKFSFLTRLIKFPLLFQSNEFITKLSPLIKYPSAKKGNLFDMTVTNDSETIINLSVLTSKDFKI